MRHAERVLEPPLGESGAVLALQTGTPDMNPTIVGIKGGSLLMIEKYNEFGLSDALVRVSNFRVFNTSASADMPSVYVRFTLTRDIPLPQIHSYSRAFEGAFSLFPDDEASGDACGCAAPVCAGSGSLYLWETCEGEACEALSSHLSCD